MKKLISFVLVVCMIFCPLNVNAAVYNDQTILKKDEKLRIVEDENIVPCYEPYCGKYATHDMRANGFGNLYKTLSDGSHQKVFTLGTCFQCSRCYLICVTQNHPNTMSIGYYGYYYADEPDISSSTTVYTKNVYFTTDYTIAGMTFSYYN